MNISLPSQMTSYVKAKVEQGNYASASEVIREALRIMQIHEEMQKKHFLQIAIEEGFSSGRAHQFSPESIKKRARVR
jgi:antitoxin ParD1/3/4